MTDNADIVTVVVLRSSDASRHEIDIPINATLNTLKDKISNVTSLGPIERIHQRLFHLGRELKSGKRSLSALGFGKHENYLVHLHSTQPKTFELSSDEEDDDVVIEDVVRPPTGRNGLAAGTKRVLDETMRSSRAHAGENGRGDLAGTMMAAPVVDLLDDSDDEEEEEDSSANAETEESNNGDEAILITSEVASKRPRT